MANKLLIIGISGVTCGGKTTLACELDKILPQTELISQDDYFLDVEDNRHVWISELNHINFDILTSLDMEKMHEDIQQYIQNKDLVSNNIGGNKKYQKFHEKNDIKTTLYEKIKNSNVEILIVEGFSIFNYKPLQSIFHLKYYFTLSKEECFNRRSQRVYEPPDCPGYFDKCVWPEHVKQLEEVQREIQNVKYFNEQTKNALEEVLFDISDFMDQTICN